MVASGRLVLSNSDTSETCGDCMWVCLMMKGLRKNVNIGAVRSGVERG